MPRKTVCIDFDGVIHSYSSPFIKPDEIPDPPFDGAIEKLNEYLTRYDIVILSTRAAEASGIEAMWRWLRSHGLDLGQHGRLKITDVKPPATLYIDDRGWQFRGKFPDFDYIDNFKPWNKR